MAAANVPTRTPQVRKDPRPRPVDGVAGWFRLRPDTMQEGKAYCWVDKASGEVDHYLSMGYEPVTWGGPTDGVQVVGGRITRQKGDKIECRGQLLMCIDREEKARIENEGEFGDSGQKYLSTVEKLLVRKRGNKDYFRGIHGIEGSLENGQFMEVENETSSPYGIQVL